MKNQFYSICLFLSIILTLLVLTKDSEAQDNERNYKNLTTSATNSISDLKDLLNLLAGSSDNEFFKLHCQSIIKVIESKTFLSSTDDQIISELYEAFSDTNVAANPTKFSSYTNRRRKLIIAWNSPTDNAVSYFKLMLPENWDPENTYPLYVELHGMWYVAEDPIEYMAYELRPGTEIDSATYNDGYSISPWGRGNLWYEDISETDIWEGIDVLEKLVKIDPARKYLNGHSMGGYGAWSIGSKSTDVWAALGIHAGALQHGGSSAFSEYVIGYLKDIPVYFVVGTGDGLFSYNQTAYQLLKDAGNERTKFVTFPGGHDYVFGNVRRMYEWLRTWSKTQTNVEINNDTSPANYMLYDNYPNPFNSTTTISYSLPDESLVKIEIYNILGKKITTLVEGKENFGTHQVRWNSEDLSSGVYLCRFRAEGKQIFERTQKLVLMK